MDHEAWEALKTIAQDEKINAQRPNVGTRVRVIVTSYSSRKTHALMGVEGRVTWHGRDKFARSRYLDSMQAHLRDLMGRYGFRVRVQPDDGEAFFISADDVCVL